MPGIRKRSGAESACPSHVLLYFAGPADRSYMSDAYPYAPDDGMLNALVNRKAQLRSRFAGGRPARGWPTSGLLPDGWKTLSMLREVDLLALFHVGSTNTSYPI